jgi:hypothetical protein
MVDESVDLYHVASDRDPRYIKAPKLFVWLDYGERSEAGPLMTYQQILLLEENTVAEALKQLRIDEESMAYGANIPKDVTHRAITLAVACALVSREVDEDLITPDVLARDWSKYLETKDEKYVERAKRRGKFGWCVGRVHCMSPHWRSEHWMYLKPGVAGRTRGRYVRRRGTMVRRDVASKLEKHDEK